MVGAALGGTLCASALMAYAVRSPSSRMLGPSIHRGSRDRRAIALTFDDGPSESTLDIVEILERYGAKATFFHCGANVERLPRVARELREAGHEIGNHGHTHTRLYLRSPWFIRDEFARAQKAIIDRAGFTPRLMRPPFGARWFGFRRVQRQLKLMGVMWTVIGYDWKLKSDSIVTRVLRNAGNGSIICLHDGRELQVNPDVRETIAAVRRLVPVLQDQGFRLETVSQLLCPTI